MPCWEDPNGRSCAEIIKRLKINVQHAEDVAAHEILRLRAANAELVEAATAAFRDVDLIGIFERSGYTDEEGCLQHFLDVLGEQAFPTDGSN